jgi:hypothetical protein
MVKKEILEQRGERRGAYYVISKEIASIMTHMPHKG